MIVWIVVALVFLGIEMHHLAFFAMFGAIGALAGAVVAAISPSALAAQIIVAAVVAALGVIAVRPYVSRAFAHRGEGALVHGVHGGIIGADAVTIDDVASHPRGHVRLLGETWLAVSRDGSTIGAGTTVNVTAVTGTTLTVKPVLTKESS